MGEPPNSIGYDSSQFCNTSQVPKTSGCINKIVVAIDVVVAVAVLAGSLPHSAFISLTSKDPGS